MSEKFTQKQDHKSKSQVTYAQLTIVAISAFIGAVAVLLFQKLVGGGMTHMDTLGLIGFTLSVLLSGASIVLAVSAIMLGKFSEDAIIRRSDESIRLQNDVFLKTTDALQRIESSTGVTEKRLEDIVSGRVGALSKSRFGSLYLPSWGIVQLARLNKTRGQTSRNNGAKEPRKSSCTNS